MRVILALVVLCIWLLVRGKAESNGVGSITVVGLLVVLAIGVLLLSGMNVAALPHWLQY